MPFTTTDLAQHINAGNLAAWDQSTAQTQGPMLAAFDLYYAGLLQWIQNNGGNVGFGQINPQTGVLDVAGLTRNNGTPYPPAVPPPQPLPAAVFTDVFYDIPTFRPQPGFLLWKAAQALIRLAQQMTNYP